MAKSAAVLVAATLFMGVVLGSAVHTALQPLAQALAVHAPSK